MTDFKALVRALAEASVEFVLVGGVAAIVHGSSRLTRDVDVVYRRSPDNLRRLALALSPYHPYLRAAPPGLPFRWDVATLERGLNFTLTTDLGSLDLLGEITGGGAFPDLLPHSLRIQIFGVECLCLDLERLIQLKRAAGRPRDLEAVAELEIILEERRRGEGRTT